MQSTEPENTATDFTEGVADLETALLCKDVSFWIEESDKWKLMAETERDRADRAEARLAEAWDEGHAAPAVAGHWENNSPRKGFRTWVEDPTPNPYRSEATA